MTATVWCPLGIAAGYWPHNPATLTSAISLLAGMLAAALVTTRLSHHRMAVAAGWVLVISGVTTIERMTSAEPAGLRMLLLISALLLGMKSLVTVHEQAAGRPRLSVFQWLPFAVAWPGMRPSTFAAVPGQPRRGWQQLLRQGAVNLLIGGVLITLAAVVDASPVMSDPASTGGMAVIALLLLPGVSLVLHFGVFHLLAGGWRRLGADCHALFRTPLRSTSLAEFWGRRWNLAFSEMTTLVVFRPLRGPLGTGPATFAAFAFSGLLHELAISLPVRDGFGLPLLYFAVQAVGMQCEQRRGPQAEQGRRIATGSWQLADRLWTAAWLILPLPLLFHLPFLRGCLWPLISTD